MCLAPKVKTPKPPAPVYAAPDPEVTAEAPVVKSSKKKKSKKSKRGSSSLIIGRESTNSNSSGTGLNI